jgi:hypothetical protein
MHAQQSPWVADVVADDEGEFRSHRRRRPAQRLPQAGAPRCWRPPSSRLLPAAGNYSIDIFANRSPFGGGAHVEVESAVPLAGTLALVGLGRAGLGPRRRAA